MPGGKDTLKKVDRFRVVICLCAAANSGLTTQREEYAAAFG
ncbi:hypothetical protein [Streptomyces sp. JJ36]|nr:hypothetical protein [Streptomyces sp. JJ36]